LEKLATGVPVAMCDPETMKALRTENNANPEQLAFCHIAPLYNRETNFSGLAEKVSY
jgi:hypothetical protein